MANQIVLISGAGIGGLTTALCLAQRGIRVAVFEQQGSEFEANGAGIQLSPNCSRVLHSLGLQEALQAKSFIPTDVQIRSWQSGRIIKAWPQGDTLTHKYGAPYYHIHRGDLLRLLLTAIKPIDSISLHTNSRVIGLQQDAASVQLYTTSGTHRGTVLIGADGIHSQVRSGLWGAEAPHFSGNLAWRTLVPTDRLPAGLIAPTTTLWCGPHKHFVHYHLRGGNLVNCVCVVEKKGWTVESWTEKGTYAELQTDFSGWHPTIQQLIENSDRDSLFKWALYDRTPMQRWGKNRVTLLGDSCHPTLPFLAQGAAMAIEDAVVLADCLSSFANSIDALQHYEQLRMKRTLAVQKAATRNASVFHLSGLSALIRNSVLKLAGSRTGHWLYRYDALKATKRLQRDKNPPPSEV